MRHQELLDSTMNQYVKNSGKQRYLREAAWVSVAGWVPAGSCSPGVADSPPAVLASAFSDFLLSLSFRLARGRVTVANRPTTDSTIDGVLRMDGRSRRLKRRTIG